MNVVFFLPPILIASSAMLQNLPDGFFVSRRLPDPARHRCGGFTGRRTGWFRKRAWVAKMRPYRKQSCIIAHSVSFS
jgi:hypothetical protein